MTTLTATIDYEPDNMEATGGLIGNWVVLFSDGTSLTASKSAIADEMNRRNVPRKAVTWTAAARKAAWAEFRKRHPRRRR